MPDNQQQIRLHLIEYLEGKHAHAGIDDALTSFPVELINAKPENSPHTFWEIIEHIRLTQNDIIDFVINPNYIERKWPQDYWPKQQADEQTWNWSINELKNDYQRLKGIVSDVNMDLLKTIPHGTGQTIFREILLIIDHNSYHIGQFILMRKMMGKWNK
jgi:hypothetical protein